MAAHLLKQALIETSAMIEEYTAAACPGCTDVCCKQKHGRYLDRDLAYLAGLGEAPLAYDKSLPPDGPCERLGPRGCRHPRWLRPFKCTWYFCDPLLAALAEGPQRKARELSAAMALLIELYDRLE